MTDDEARGAILAALGAIEAEEEVRVLYACESGSRAWGFASADSDYDCRFVYLRRSEWYVRIDQGMTRKLRSTIERPGDPLDVCGWDLRKTLWLLAKSNPPLLEWLHSPIVYRTGPEADELRGLATGFYSPARCLHHYLSMAERNFREYLRGERVWTKKYLYVLRPVLAYRWLEAGRGVVPVELSRLASEALPDRGGLRSCVEDLLARKRAGLELDDGPRIGLLSEFLEGEIERLREVARASSLEVVDLEPLNAFFRRAAGF